MIDFLENKISSYHRNKDIEKILELSNSRMDNTRVIEDHLKKLLESVPVYIEKMLDSIKDIYGGSSDETINAVTKMGSLKNKNYSVFKIIDLFKSAKEIYREKLEITHNDFLNKQKLLNLSNQIEKSSIYSLYNNTN